MSEPLIFERSVSGRRGYVLPPSDVPAAKTTAVPTTTDAMTSAKIGQAIDRARACVAV